MSGKRASPTEGKYGRIPLWLYESGVPLQAIATYGWLAGRYGHYDKVMPSYGTLAKELKVSRGSVIAYIRELVAVGAIRVANPEEGNRRCNEYTLAAEAPFDVSPARGLSRLGWAYAVSSTARHRVKIGHSDKPQQRLLGLQCGSSEPLEVIWQAEGGAELERHLHDHFAPQHLHGEWFDFTDMDAVALIASAARAFDRRGSAAGPDREVQP